MSEADFKSAYGTRNYERDKVRKQWGKEHYVLYRRADVGSGSWFFRYHIKGEGRHFRKALGTTDFAEAEAKGHDLMIDLSTRIRGGQKIISPTLRDVEARFWEHQQELVAADRLRPRTLVMQRYRIGLGRQFLEGSLPAGWETRVAAVDGAVFNTYRDWRNKRVAAKGRSIRRDVVRDELLVIRKLFVFARQNKWCGDNAIPSWSFHIEPDGPIRQRLTATDFARFKDILHRWTMEPKNARDAYNRVMLNQFVMTIANTGLRSGELFNMRNRDLKIIREAGECVLSVRREYSKVKKCRDVTLTPVLTGGRLENYLIDWVDTAQRHKEPNHFVFAPYETGAKDARDVYYHTYKTLRLELKKVGLEWFDTYHCRHAWITEQLEGSHSIHDVAKAAGTSAEQIEETYSHVSTEQTTRAFGKARLRQMAATQGAMRHSQRLSQLAAQAQPELRSARLIGGELPLADAFDGAGSQAEGATDADVAKARAA